MSIQPRPFIMRDPHGENAKGFRTIYGRAKARGLWADKSPVGTYVISKSRGGPVMISGNWRQVMDWLSQMPVTQARGW